MTNQTKTDEAVNLHRFAILKLAENLGNVSEACRLSGTDRTSFYKWKRRYQTSGLEGLKNLPPVHKNHPLKTPKAIEDTILEFRFHHPDWSCELLSSLIFDETNVRISAQTVRNILKKYNLDLIQEPFPQEQASEALFNYEELEHKAISQRNTLSKYEIETIERYNPCLKDYKLSCSRPGQQISQDIFKINNIPGIAKARLHVVVDIFNSFAFGFFKINNLVMYATSLLSDIVIPFYQNYNLTVKVISFNYKRIFKNGIYYSYLTSQNIFFNSPRFSCQFPSGAIERLKMTVLNEFIPKVNHCNNLDSLQSQFVEWLHYYNHERPIQGYRNNGKTPSNALTEYLKGSPPYSGN